MDFLLLKYPIRVYESDMESKIPRPSTIALARQPKPVNRAKEVVNSLKVEAALVRQSLAADESMKLYCAFGGERLAVWSVGAWDEHIVRIDGDWASGDKFRIFSSVEQISFMFMISKKVADSPQREIGFHADYHGEM